MRLDQNSCFKVDYSEIKSNGGILIIGFNLSESVFIHAVTHAQDLLDGATYLFGTQGLKIYIQNYEIFIGEFADYTKNAKVPGGPFLHPDN